MRAIFTVSLNKKSQSTIATKEDFINTLKFNGWEDVNLVPDNVNEKSDGQRTYSDATASLWGHMPEIAQDEKDYLIYYFRLVDTQTDVIITHRNKGTVKFRLLNPDLEKLLEACELLIRELTKPEDSKSTAYIVNSGRVEILEKGDIHLIIRGRVIANHFKEAKRVNGKNFYLGITMLIAFILLIVGLVTENWIHVGHETVLFGSTERLSTVAITTAIVSGFDFWQTYRRLKSNKIISWKVSTELEDRDLMSSAI